jgi:hypothetical protein
MSALPPAELAVVMVVALVGVPLMAILHELTHVLFIWPVADSVDIRWREMFVRARVPDTPWHQRWASLSGLAPLIVGVFVAVYLAWLGTPLQPPTTVEGILQWGLWMSYTIFGGVSDYLPSVSRDRGARTAD